MVRKKYYPPGSPELVNPMIRFPTKACQRCGVVKPNTREIFGSKNWGTKIRDPLTGLIAEVPQTTTDVCKACTAVKRSAQAVSRREADLAYEKSKFEDLLALAKRGADKSVEIVAPTVDANDPEIKMRRLRASYGLALDGSEDHKWPKF